MATFPPRRAEPGQRFTTHHYLDGEVTLHADDDGLVPIRTGAQQRAADEFGLPVARVKEDPKTPAPPVKEA